MDNEMHHCTTQYYVDRGARILPYPEPETETDIFLGEPLAIDGAMGYNDSKIGVSPAGGAENTHA